MASKTVWIVGGVVVAIGAIAYLSHNKAPAGKDAAGTIVEAKRARADGTNSFNPTPTASTTDQNSSDASKAMAGPDAAKDAAEAAGSGDNARRAQMEGGTKSVAHAPEAMDAAAAAAKSGASNSRHPNAMDAAKAMDAAAAAKSQAGSNLRGASSAQSQAQSQAQAQAAGKD
jgi:hypothetical protein